MFKADTGLGHRGFESTPLKVGNRLFLCTGRSDVIALDAETGAELWRFDAGISSQAIFPEHCRGVSYFEPKDTTGTCAERIITNTIDARLIALDAKTGQISLLTGMGGCHRVIMSRRRRRP
jgi:quinoprotein glucose dehydrogenase